MAEYAPVSSATPINTTVPITPSVNQTQFIMTETLAPLGQRNNE